MKGKKLLSAIIAGAMVLGTMSFPAFAEESTGPDPVEEFLSLNAQNVYDKHEIDLKGATVNVDGEYYSNIYANIKIKNGTINFSDFTTTDGIFRIGYWEHNAPVTLTLEDMTINVTNVTANTGVFTMQNQDDTLVLNNSTINATRITDTPGIFYTPNGENSVRGSVKINGGRMNVETGSALFFNNDVDLNSTAITCKVDRPVFRQSAGSVEDTTITVNGVIDGAKRGIVEDIADNPKGTVAFINCNVVAPADQIFVKANTEDKILAVADNASTYTVGGTVKPMASEETGVQLVAASIGKNYYLSLNDAITSLADASGDVVINVLDDTQLKLAGFYVPLVNDNIKSLTINGNGHSINVIADYRLRLWMTGKLIINNATLTSDWYEAYTWDSWDFLFDCETELTDVTLNREIALEQDAKLTNVTINNSSADDSYAIWIPTNGQNIALDNVTINASGSGKRGIKIDNQYVDDAAVGKVELKVENSTFNTNKKAAILVKSPVGATITANNNNITNVNADKVNLVWVDSDIPASYSKVNVTIDGVATAPYLEDTGIGVARIGNSYYTTLADAVAAAESGDTVTLLGNTSGNGIVNEKDITIDLGGYTYTIDGTTVGSSGTETNGFQLLAGSDTSDPVNVTIKNGTIKSTSSTAQIMIQNYSDLTLEDVVLDGTELTGWKYALSNNCGNVVLKGNTSIYAASDGVAFDSCKFSSYPAPTVTVETTGIIDGDVKLTGGSLVVKSGTFTDSEVLDYLATGSNYTTADGKITVKNYIFGKVFYMNDIPVAADSTEYQLGLYAGIDSLNYKKVGFIIEAGGNKIEYDTNTVYSSVVGTSEAGEEMTVTADYIGAYRIFGLDAFFPKAYNGMSIIFTPFAEKLDGTRINGYSYTVDKLYTK